MCEGGGEQRLPLVNQRQAMGGRDDIAAVFALYHEAAA
jgi:hypothetical protein